MYTENIFNVDCPIGHANELTKTNIKLPEGHLSVCKKCGHLVSSCSISKYNKTMQQFNCVSGTLPKGKSKSRAFKLHAKRLNKIKQILNKPANKIKLLDLGCSSGAFLNSARALNFDVEGVEPAKLAAETAIQNGLKVHIGTLNELKLPYNSYDVITMFEVIEHLQNPQQVLFDAKKLLKPGGLIIIGTANTDSWTNKFMKNRWEYYDLQKHGGHISFFNTNSIKLLTENIGFSVLEIKTRCVKFFERNEIPKPIYKFFKIFTELCNIPAQWFNKGHDMLVIAKNNL